MTETLTNPSERATSWLQALASRGVTVAIRNNRLHIIPARAHKELSDDEIITLRHHRQAIKALVREGNTYATAAHEPAPAVEKPTPALEPPCRWCNRSPCIGREHQAFATLHALDPEEVERRHREANEDDYDQRIAHAQGWPTSRMIEKARGPKTTDEERRQAELRRKLGWEGGGTRRV